MDPRTLESRSNREREIEAGRLDFVNQWLLSMERPKVSGGEIAWNDFVARQIWSITPEGEFRMIFLGESYPGTMGDGFNG